MSRPSVGILGIGTFLPEQVRTNDWWPAATVERWLKDASRAQRPDLGALTAGEQLVLGKMAASASDTFKGAVERRVLSDSMLPSDAESAAARIAIERAGLKASDIDFILTSSFVPDALNVPNAFVLHRTLGLPTRCYTSGLDAGCNAFPLQLALAEQMIAGGQAKRGLLVQSSILSRLLPFEEPFSTYFGDGASAVVVGPVSSGRGILGRAHFANGHDCGALVAGVPGKRWYDEGRSYWYQGEKKTVFKMLLSVADIGKQAIDSALLDAKLDPSAVDFFACHQGTPWFRAAVQEHSGLSRARTLDTFELAASLVGANLGLVLDGALAERSLRDDDVVALFASGVGTTWSGLVMRWGT